jgi:Zn-dependent protease
MLNKNEILAIVVTTLILGFTIAITDLKNLFLISLLYIFIIILINVIFKKVASFYADTEIEILHWEAKRYGVRPHQHFNKPIQIGLVIPILVKVLTLGFINWTAALTFEVKGKNYRAARRHGIYSFSEVTEAQMGYIAAVGIIANLAFAVLGYFIGFEEFAKLSLGYAFFNMIPISTLDGNKIFFGNLTLWNFLAAIVLLGVLAVMIII